jgi:hypothetical protein
MRHPYLTLAALMLAAAPAVRAQNPDALRHAGAFAVQVAWDDDADAHRLGLDTAVLRTKTELVVRQSGLPLVRVAPGDTLPDAVFRVYVSALQLETDAAEPEKLKAFAYLLTAKYVEWLPIRGQSMFADVWTCSRYGVTEEIQFIYNTATQCVEEFANQWLSVNPRQ